MAWGAIEGNQTHSFDSDAKHCMAWGAIEGNQTHPFDSDAKHCMAWQSKAIEHTHCAGCQALHSLGCLVCNRTVPFDSGSTDAKQSHSKNMDKKLTVSWDQLMSSPTPKIMDEKLTVSYSELTGCTTNRGTS